MIYLEGGKVCLGEGPRQGKTIQINYKMNFSTFLKMLLSHRYIFCHILRTIPKDFPFFSKFCQFISTSHSLPFKFTHAFIHRMKDGDFRPNTSW